MTRQRCENHTMNKTNNGTEGVRTDGTSLKNTSIYTLHLSFNFVWKKKTKNDGMKPFWSFLWGKETLQKIL